MSRSMIFGSALLLVGAEAASAQVFVRAPFVRVQVGDGVRVRAPFVNLYVPSGPRYYVAPPPAYYAPPPTYYSAPPPRVYVPAPDPVPRTMPPAREEPPVREAPPKDAPPVEIPAGKAPTLDEFSRTFKPKPGNYELTLLSPVTREPTTVRFTLPEGTPQRTYLTRNSIEFEYGRLRFVRIEFDPDGAVVIWR